jgi:hypothetical protein
MQKLAASARIVDDRYLIMGLFHISKSRGEEELVDFYESMVSDPRILFFYIVSSFISESLLLFYNNVSAVASTDVAYYSAKFWAL